jgi:hypothetical protein
MVVQHGQRMTAPRARRGGVRDAGQREVSLEVHLPQVVGPRALEAGHRRVLVRLVRVEQPVPAEDAGDRAGGGDVIPPVTEVRQAAADLAAAPGRMPAAELDHPRLVRVTRALGGVVRLSRAVGQGIEPAGLVPLDPLVKGLGADAAAAAQLADVDAITAAVVGGNGQDDQFVTLGHERVLLPRHARPPC